MTVSTTTPDDGKHLHAVHDNQFNVEHGGLGKRRHAAARRQFQ